jgi:hypothetical protein
LPRAQFPKPSLRVRVKAAAEEEEMGRVEAYRAALLRTHARLLLSI